MELRVVGIGALNYDKLYFVDKIASGGEEIKILEAKEEAGGSAANTITALSRLGIKTGFIGVKGKDVEGRKITEAFKREGVNTEGIREGSKPTGVVIGFVDARGERALYLFSGANDDFSADDKNIEYAKNAGLLHLSSFALEKGTKEEAKLIKKVKSKNKKIMISYAPGFLCARGMSFLGDIIKETDILFCNEDEIKGLTKEKELKKAAEVLIDHGISIICITQGKKGCTIAAKNKLISLHGLKVKAKDTTGAGDAFAGGFLYGFLNKKPLELCAKMGNFAAAKCIEKEGARSGLPAKKELEKAFKSKF